MKVGTVALGSNMPPPLCADADASFGVPGRPFLLSILKKKIRRVRLALIGKSDVRVGNSHIGRVLIKRLLAKLRFRIKVKYLTAMTA